jgi:hypothetical protein
MMVVSFIGGGNQSTQRKPLTCRKSLTVITRVKRLPTLQEHLMFTPVSVAFVLLDLYFSV